MESKKICFIDFETTGLDRSKDWPLQLGALLVEYPSGKILERFGSEIKPPRGSKNTAQAFEIHGLDLGRLMSTAPAPDVVVSKFFDQMGTDFAFGGWNINFDLAFMHRLCAMCSAMQGRIYLQKVDYRHLDVQSVAQAAYFTGQVSVLGGMHELAMSMGVLKTIPAKHNALHDATMTYDIYRELLYRLKPESKKEPDPVQEDMDKVGSQVP